MNKIKLKKITSICLASLMLISTPTISRAEIANGDGSGNANTGSTEEYVGSYHAYHVNQGTRMYLVNSKGIPVTNTADFVRYFPEDIGGGASASSEAFNKMYNNYNNKTGYLDKSKSYIEYLGGAKTDDWYVPSITVLDHGKLNQSTMSELDYSNDLKKNGLMCTTRGDGDYSKDNSEVYVINAKMYTYSIIEQGLVRVAEQYGYNPIITGENGTIQVEVNINGVNTVIPVNTRFLDPLYETKNGLDTSGNELKNMLMAHINSKNPITGEEIKTNTLQVLMDMEVPKMDGRGRKRQGETGTEKIFDFLDPKLRAEYETEVAKGNNGAKLDVIRNNNLKIAVEPVHWSVGEVTYPTDKYGRTGYNQNAFYCTNYVVYGTTSKALYYIAKQLGTDSVVKSKYPDMPNINNSLLEFAEWANGRITLGWDWGLGDSCYMLNHDETELGMQKYDPSIHDSLRNLLACYSNLGYGIMFFGLDDNTEGAITSTYDKAVTGMAPSPENTNSDGTFPSKYPSEGKEYAEKGKDHSRNIVKFYCEKQTDGTYDYFENHVRNNTVSNIIIENEGEYEVDGYFTSPEYKAPENENSSYDEWKDLLPKGEFSGSKAEQIKMSATSADTTLYMRLCKVKEEPESEIPDSVKLILHENELSHTFTLESLNSLVTLTHNFQNKEKSGRGDHGYWHDDDDGDSHWHSDWRTWYRQISDDSYGYVMSNHNNYGSTTFIGSQGAFTSQELGTVADSGTLGMSGGNTNGLTPNLKFSIYRDSAKDNVTLYPNKNNSVKGELAQIGISSDSYIPANKRILKEGTSQWYSQFTTNYVYDTEDNTLSWDCTCSEHGDSGSWNGTSNPTLADFNKVYSQSNNVLSKAFLGKAGKGEDVSSLTASAFNILSKNFSKNLSYKTGGDKFISFYPYTKMNYQTVNDETLKNVYVTSENLSEVRNISAVEAGVYQSKSGYGIEIGSEQWSTHVRAIEGLKAKNVSAGLANKSLIPGGATIDLKSANSSSEAPEVWVGLRTYELSVPDSLVGTLTTKDGVKTTSEAKANANQFIEDAKSILSQYQLEKWIMEGIAVNESELNSGTAKKVSGINPVGSFGGNNLSKDSKYYLKTDGADGSSAKFDVLNTQTEQHVYNISSDTQGRVSFKKDGTEIASDNIKQSKSLSNLLSNAEVKKVDERTKIVSNFIKSLDFEGGSNRDSQPWYYEAQDGLEAVETLVGIQVGFGGSSPVRSEVVDIKLTGKLDGKSDILNFNDDTIKEKTRTVQYRMSDRSTSAKASGKPNNYVGTFNGLDITIPGMNTVMRTRLTYMGNNTVQDLN